MKKFEYFQPETLKDAWSLMEKGKGTVRYIAGGTDILVNVKNRTIEPAALISLRRIKELAGIRRNKELTVGSMTLLRELERDAGMAGQYPALSQAVWALATPQVRNVATIGGNLCNAAPSADCAPPLLVMEATATLAGPDGRRDVSIEDFFTGPGQTCMDSTEVLTQIKIQPLRKHTGTSFLKLGRVSTDIAMVNAAAILTMNGKTCARCRLAVGAVAPVPLRLRSVEKMIEGNELSAELLDEAAQMVENEVKPITDVRSTAEYRRITSGVLIKRAIEQAMQAAEERK
ncbi:MAG: FAD binding domain-containing protein [Thermodesulfobacteriota bacterium]